MLLSMTAIRAAAVAQNLPSSSCDFPGFEGNPNLAEVASVRSTTGYFGCSSAGNCLPTQLQPGNAILVDRVGGDWTCGYLSQSEGAGPGRVRSRDLRAVPFNPDPALDAWVGTWKGGEESVSIQKSKLSGELKLNGDASWHGRVGVVHTGDAAPNANHLHFVEAETGSCTVDLTLIGDYIVANDNGACGGANVRFGGILRRATVRTVVSTGT